MTDYSCLSVAWSAPARVGETARLWSKADAPALWCRLYLARPTIAAPLLPHAWWPQEAGIERAMRGTLR
jgi:hypothetical protein